MQYYISFSLVSQSPNVQLLSNNFSLFPILRHWEPESLHGCNHVSDSAANLPIRHDGWFFIFLLLVIAVGIKPLNYNQLQSKFCAFQYPATENLLHN